MLNTHEELQITLSDQADMQESCPLAHIEQSSTYKEL